MAQLEFYVDPIDESVLAMAPSGEEFVFISKRAHVSCSLKNKFDKQQKAGKNFGRVKFIGTELASFTVTFDVLAGSEDADFVSEVIPLLRRPGKNGVSPPFDVANRQIQNVGIQTVTVVSADIGPPEAGIRQVTILLEEWAPTPVTIKKDTSKKATNDPLDINAGLSSIVEIFNQ